MTLLSFFFFVVLASAASSKPVPVDDCHPVAGGYQFDLSALKRPGDPLRFSTHRYYYFTMCSNIEADIFSAVCGSKLPASALQLYGSTCVRLARFKKGATKTELERDHHGKPHGIRVTYGDGEHCTEGGKSEPRSTTVVITCDRGGIQPTALSQKGCNTLITLPHPAGCYTAVVGGGIGFGWIAIIILLVLALIYIVAGFIVTIKVKGVKPGPQAFPNLEFWKELPKLVFEGLKFTILLMTSPCRHGRTAGLKGYNEV